MFERYTEKARRVIFFARYEAANLGSPSIETEHILLAIMRECHDAGRLFGHKLGGYAQLRTKVESLSGKKPSSSPFSTDLPLSNEGKRVLAYGAEEAERMRDRHIGAEHLFLGLLHEQNCRAARIMQEHGITLDKARARIKRDLGSEPVSGTEPAGATKIHGAILPGDYVRARAKEYLCFAWERRPWKPRDILVDKQTGRVMFYTGQSFDPARFDLTQGGWKRDHCAICSWQLYESDEPLHGIGYTNGRDWVCTECHDKFLVPPLTPLDDLYT